MGEKDKVLSKSVSHDEFATEKANVISNNLLGSYVGDKYVIADDISDELIKCKKIKKSVFQNSVFCGAMSQNYGELVFEVTFQKNTVKNIAMAELYILENEYRINGYIQNTIRTKIGQYVDELDNFIEKTYNHFNISLTENSGREYNLEEDISLEAYIGAKTRFNENMLKLTQKDYNGIYKDYVTARLELLKKINSPYTQLILEQFNNEYSKIEKYFLKNNNYKALSELLDKCIEDCSGINPKFAEQEKEFREKMTPILSSFTKKADEILETAQTKAINNLNKEDKTLMEAIEYSTNKKAVEMVKEVKEKPTTPIKEAPVKETPKTETPTTEQSSYYNQETPRGKSNGTNVINPEEKNEYSENKTPTSKNDFFELRNTIKGGVGQASVQKQEESMWLGQN